MSDYSSTQNFDDDFYARAELFRQANKNNPYAWYTALATSNLKSAKNATSSKRPLLGLIKYCLFELPFFAEKSKPYDVVFASVLTKHQTSVRETFFGDLPKNLVDQGYRCAVVGKIAWIYNRSIEGQARDGVPCDVYCPSHLLSKWDGLKCVLKSLKARFSYDGMNDVQKEQSQIEIQAARYHDIVIGLLYQAMLVKVKKANADLKIIHGFEGNTWESSCALVDETCTGYQHGAVLKDQFKVTPFDGRPYPKRIISSGTQSSHALMNVGGVQSDQLRDGYALRIGDIYNHLPKESYPDRITRVLYVMQGGEDANGIFDMLAKIKNAYPHIDFVLRPHPAHPVDESESPLPFTQAQSLYDDIMDADMVLYADSTAAFEAVVLGVPVVALSPQSDPLFQCSSMHHVLRDVNDLENIIDLIEKSSSFDSDFNQARGYVENYFRCPTDKTKDDFIQWLSLSSVS